MTTTDTDEGHLTDLQTLANDVRDLVIARTTENGMDTPDRRTWALAYLGSAVMGDYWTRDQLRSITVGLDQAIGELA